MATQRQGREGVSAVEIGISVKEAARRIGCDPSRVRKLIRRGLLSGYRDGRSVRIYESAVVAYQNREPLRAAGAIEPTPVRNKPDRTARYREALAYLRRQDIG